MLSVAYNAAVGWNEKVLEEFLSSSLGKKIKEEWRRAESEQAIQECLDIMIPELLQKLHGQEHETSRPTYYNKCGGASSECDSICGKQKQ